MQMKTIYLMRHGNAVDPSVDYECPLSDLGRLDIQRAADFFEGNVEVRVKKMYHSKKLRAKQTADIIASAVLEEGRPEEIEGLNPSDSISDMVDRIDTWQEDVWLVGHLPFMAKLLSRMLLGHQDASLSAIFQTGSVACLEKDTDSGIWVLNWFIRPHLLQ